MDVICKKWTGVGFVKAGLGMTLGRQFSCIRQTKRRCKLSRLEWPRGQKFGLGLNHWPRNTVASAFGFWPSPWIQCPWITEVGRLTLAMESWLRLFCCQETSITLLRKPATLRLLPTHPQWRRHTTLIITGRDSGIWKALINRQNNSYQLRQFRPNSRIICLYWDFFFISAAFIWSCAHTCDFCSSRESLSVTVDLSWYHEKHVGPMLPPSCLVFFSWTLTSKWRMPKCH